MFKILSLEIIRHNFFNAQKIEFINNGEENEGPYVSLIIGPNGTGKSQILGLIVDLFNIIAASQEKITKVQNFPFDFELQYLMSGNRVVVRSIKNNDSYSIDHTPSDIFQIPVPSKFLASAINLTDRFPNLTQRRKVYNKKYEYLGIRSASNNAFINTHVKSIIDKISLAVSEDLNLPRFTKLFNHLGLKEEISIMFKAGPRLTLEKKEQGLPSYLKSEKALYEYFTRIIKPVEKGKRMTIRFEKYSNVINDSKKLIEVIDFAKEYESVFTKQRKGDVKFNARLNFEEITSVIKYNQNSKALQYLRELELLVFDKVLLSRLDSKYSFEQSSSGEYHVLSSFIAMFSTIQDSSLVLIDEPEISLHPNWQMKYMNLLYSLFEDFKSCHFIVSTHSHFLVSDLPFKKSSIISFKRNEKGNIVSENLSLNTEGWAAENILYTVFEVANTRNFYFENDLRKVLHLVSSKAKGSEAIKTIRTIYDKLVQFNIPEGDPMEIILDDIKKYLETNEA